MKKIYILLAIAMLYACEQRKLSGYIVYKSYTPTHMCCTDPKSTVEASMIYVPTPVVHHHTHSEQKECYRIFVGNYQGTTEVEVTSNTYNKFHVTDKVYVFGNHIKMIRKGCKK